MTAFTRNLPWFIKDLGISVVGQKCYVSLVENLNLEDVECLKYSLSKGLGLGIVVGGSVMKVPQLLLILNAKSARGVSLPSYILETLSYAITLAYSARNHFPFSTYGENLFLTAQNIVITLLIALYSSQPAQHRPLTGPAPNPNGLLAGLVFFTLINAVALASVPHNVLALLQLSTVPISLFSKIPQIMQNARARSTGQLSAVAVLAQIGGCAARLFTTAQEVGDVVVSAGFAVALFLNIVLGVQMWTYWVADTRASPAHQPVSVEKFQEKFDIVVPPQSPAPGSQPAHQAQPASYGRKWARKVD
ncbi:mannose-P-dolichol utilization defect 1 protein [Auriscalpium vulgare]|uniref:Mannose-P-dolichol utilization defect 1 protein n=1 Tax=Auriscalpium vulgare TaxID=40419 RepID=A0ACB8S9Z8_9AGAM|nr:mannose-P-dolichol utilization defect 1 protein [Auriscalpium vulgare]